MTRSHPLITAHAGCMGTRPNGREHVVRALFSGADVVELDIRLSADGHVVLSHDEEAVGPDGLRRALGSLSWEEIRSLAGEGAEARILDLDEAFDLIGGTAVVNLDAKEPAAAVAAAAVARRRGAAESIVFSGLEPEAAAELRDELRGFARLLNADPILPIAGYGPDSMREALRVARDCGCCGLNLDFRAATEALVDYAHPRCLPVFLWTADEPEEMERVLSLRPFSVTTNRPDLLARMIEGSV